MEARIEDGRLVIELPLENPRPSSTGKTLLSSKSKFSPRNPNVGKSPEKYGTMREKMRKIRELGR